MLLALKCFGVTDMGYLHILPMTEVLILNLITLDHCFKRKYSIFKTVVVLFAFTVIFVLSLVLLNRDIFLGNGKFSIGGFVYIIPLKFLYNDKLERLFLNMCMVWIYTLGIMAVSVQAANCLSSFNYEISLILIQTILFLFTFIPFRKYVMPKYIYIFKNMYDFQKTQFRYLEISIYLNFFIFAIFHIIFLGSEKYLLQMIIFIMFLAANYLFCAIVYEVINSSIKIDELEESVSHDALTGLGNRTQMLKRMRLLIQENHIFSIMFLDLDRFKLINDQYGHDVGDRYLKHFGKVCSEELKDSGKLFRYGGDEFVAIYYGVLTKEIADSIAQCKNWNEGAPCAFNEVSVGFVVCKPPYSVKDPEIILKRADSIMYRNKLNRKMNNYKKS